MTISSVSYNQLHKEGEFANWLFRRRYWIVGLLDKKDRFIVQSKDLIYKLTEYLKPSKIYILV